MANKADLEKGLALRNKLLGKRASGAATVIAELAPDLDEIMSVISASRSLAENTVVSSATHPARTSNDYGSI